MRGGERILIATPLTGKAEQDAEIVTTAGRAGGRNGGAEGAVVQRAGTARDTRSDRRDGCALNDGLHDRGRRERRGKRDRATRQRVGQDAGQRGHRGQGRAGRFRWCKRRCERKPERRGYTESLNERLAKSLGLDRFVRWAVGHFGSNSPLVVYQKLSRPGSLDVSRQNT